MYSGEHVAEPHFSKVPKIFGRISGDPILFESSKQRGLEARNFAVISIFILFTTYEKKTALLSMQVGVLQMAFLTRELFGTFEKRAPGLNLTVKLDFGNSSFVIEKKKMKTTRKNEKKKKKNQF